MSLGRDVLNKEEPFLLSASSLKWVSLSGLINTSILSLSLFYLAQTQRRGKL